MIILITGASGFIGYHLSKKLSLDFKNKLYLVDNHYRGEKDKEFKILIKKKNIKYIKADLTNIKELKKLPKKIDLVFHLAAINGTENFYNIPDKVIKTNTQININIFEYIKNKKTKIIFSSSSEVYSSTTSLLKNRIPSDEKIEISIDDITNVRYSYAVSKIWGESYLFSLLKNYNVSFSIVRFHNIYGPRMGHDHVIPQLIRRVKNGKTKIELFGYLNTRSFCYIDDAIDSLQIITKNINNNIVNIGNDLEEINISNLLKKILNICNKKLKVIKKSAPKGSVKRRLPNISKIKSLGFTPKINLNNGLKETISWYFKNDK